MAQTRLPVFYRSFDTLEPRFTLLALHFFAVLASLCQRGVRGQDNGGSAFIGAIKATLRDETENAELRSKALASYLLLEPIVSTSSLLPPFEAASSSSRT